MQVSRRSALQQLQDGRRMIYRDTSSQDYQGVAPPRS